MKKLIYAIYAIISTFLLSSVSSIAFAACVRDISDICMSDQERAITFASDHSRGAKRIYVRAVGEKPTIKGQVTVTCRLWNRSDADLYYKWGESANSVRRCRREGPLVPGHISTCHYETKWPLPTAEADKGNLIGDVNIKKDHAKIKGPHYDFHCSF
jgi:hypothetical protein